MSLEGKVAVVTGGGRGIGQAIATVLAAKGATVAIWDLNKEGADATAAEIRENGGTAIALEADIADRDSIAEAATRTRAAVGSVNIVVNNAGITAYEPFATMTEDAWDRMIQVNLKGTFLVTQEFIAEMLDDGKGRIVNISSSSAQTGAPAMAHYAASKGGVIGFTKALAMEFADKGITVNHVPPGFVDTPLVREGPVDVEQVATMMPMKRAGQPADVAHAVAYLASDEAAYVTGQTLSVNGGRYLF
ncbi:SDR family oxidoreductase [Gordonia insulae]|uniref:3-oxoacyl-[acyl-carrier-protein] reductase MabA n=1 Tax=Gordonia insulae TaxID=2420509 RepID=A0A3G8JNC2_9ACTN|nr:SDR family NAD(P)-dependent oxidoreductase [Gordonia insulae]AZG45949.1 3-oxoacyl-[acyl-carrier-protein] reductase FabG [Gordonia insulae]